MAASQANIGYGGRVFVETSASPTQSPPDYHELDEITTMTGPNFQTDDVDVSHMQSPNRTREFVPGMIDPGEASFEMNWIPGSTTDAIILALKRDGTIVSWKMQWYNATTWEFTGYVKGYETGTSVEDKNSATVTIRVSGDIATSYVI